MKAKVTDAQRQKIMRELAELKMSFNLAKLLSNGFKEWDDYDMLGFMQQLRLFNSVFAGGALLAASNWSIRASNLQSNENFYRYNLEVASLLLRSVLDELALGQQSRMCHAQMSYKLVETMAGKLQLQVAREKTFIEIPYAILIRDWYSRSRFEALGFHYASEKFATTEFSEINKHFKKHFAAMYTHLCATEFYDQTADGSAFSRPAISWLTDHIELEQEHFAFTQEAVILALQTCETPNELATAKNQLLHGATQFLNIQEGFFKGQLSQF